MVNQLYSNFFKCRKKMQDVEPNKVRGKKSLHSTSRDSLKLLISPKNHYAKTRNPQRQESCHLPLRHTVVLINKYK